VNLYAAAKDGLSLTGTMIYPGETYHHSSDYYNSITHGEAFVKFFAGFFFFCGAADPVEAPPPGGRNSIRHPEAPSARDVRGARSIAQIANPTSRTIR
jgi:hypothetical protein